jgi:hypothetical protein
VVDTAPGPGIARPGWIDLTYVQDAIPDATTKEIRFPSYPTAGHAVTVRASAELLADVSQWYSSSVER